MRFPCRLALLVIGSTLPVFIGVGPARAEDLPKSPRAAAAPASAGKTDVASEGFTAPEAKEEAKEVTVAEISAGGLITSGNSRQLALTASSRVRVRRLDHQFGGALAANFAQAAATTEADMETTVLNLQGRVRYDYFFADHWSAFLGVSARRDRFQGLDLRLNVDPGVAYYVMSAPAHQLWFELGYDLQFDVRREENLAEAEAAGTVLDRTESRHSARAFVGYTNKLNERVSFDTGLEYIQSVESGESENWRLNYDAVLTSNIAGNFSTAVTFMLKYDNNPLPGIEELDLLTSFNLVYTLL